MAFATFKEELEQLQLEHRLQEDLRKKREIIMGKLQKSAEQLREVGGEPCKLSIRHKEDWQEQEFLLAMLDAEFVQAAMEQKDFNAMYYDPLTLLRNKAFYGKLLGMLEGRPLALVTAAAHLYSFKLVNYHWPHARGDAAITQVADCINEYCRAFNEQQSDAVCVPFRFGGDEFAIAFISHEESHKGGGYNLQDLSAKLAALELCLVSILSTKPSSQDTQYILSINTLLQAQQTSNEFVFCQRSADYSPSSSRACLCWCGHA